MTAYYNEIDPFAAAWLRELIQAGHIAPGVVDERSIEDVSADDLVGFTQVHLFAGVGGWSLAARLAGWPDDRPLWTGSCPCQPFSTAGQRRGADDERHLWPVMRRLVDERRPSIVVGEQVASGLGRDWLSAVRSDLEELGYAVGAADLCAAGIGAPHIRQRLYWGAVGVANAPNAGSPRRSEGPPAEGVQEWQDPGPDRYGPLGCTRDSGDPMHEGWIDLDWLLGRDHRWRPVRSGSSPLAHGIPARVGRLRGYGNAIVPQTAAAFLQALAA